MKKLRVTVEGKVYDVLVEVLDEGANSTIAPAPSYGGTAGASVSAAPVSAPAATPPPAAAPAAGAAGGPGTVRSPLAGKVVSLQVKVGDTVAEGAQMATLEAMKMNTYINAPKAGRIEEIFVNPGDAVDEGSALLRIA